MRILKTLVVLVYDDPWLAMAAHRVDLDLGALAALAGGRRAQLADPAAAEKLTGYQLGGISPLGTRRVLRTAIDETAILFETVLCSAGRRGLQVELAPGDLARLTDATFGAIGRER